MEKNEELKFEYIFEFDNSKTVHFTIQLDPTSLNYISLGKPRTADWAKLENEKCTNCPLDSLEHPHCPIALNLVNILPEFSDIYSYEEASITVKTPERNFSTHTAIQGGLGSMLGIYMVSSGCPVMAKLKPMVRFHLPFASVEETIFRAASMHLMEQYFKNKKGMSPDWTLDGLTDIYKEVQKVNIAMADRLRSLQAKDANINALIVLDVFAKELPINIENSLESLSYLFDE